MAAILLDVDGVLHVSGEPIPGAVDAVKRLREDGLGRELLLAGPRVLGERASADAEHLVAWAEPGHALADCFHHAR